MPSRRPLVDLLRTLAGLFTVIQRGWLPAPAYAKPSPAPRQRVRRRRRRG